MTPPTLARRITARLTRNAKRLVLEGRRRRVGGEDLFVDYGWLRLLYTGDGDGQEVAYHLNQAEWHEKDMHVFRSLLAPGETVIDVGANLGFITTMLASIVGPQGRVLSFEPSPVVFAKLKKTVAANGLHQVEALNMGCGRESSTQRLNRVSASSGNSSIVGSGAEGIDIRVEPLDEVPEIWQRPVKLLKIDTEGYEPEVLAGATRLLAEHRPIVYLEMGGDYVESTLESMRMLDEAGYGVDHVRQIEWSTVGNGSDYFFLPR